VKSVPKPSRKTILSPETEALAAQWIADLSALPGKAAALLPQIKSLPPGEREAFLARILGEAGEEGLSFFEALKGADEGLDEPLIRACAHGASARAAKFLADWAAQNPSKNLRKEIRKSLFRLRSRGVEVPDLEDPSPGVFRPPRQESRQAYASALDAGGTRLLFLGLPQPPQGMFVFHAALNDREGIQDFAGFESSAKKFHDLLEQTRREVPWEIVGMDPEYAKALLGEAHETHLRSGRPPHPEYMKWKSLLGPAAALPLRPLIYHHLDEEGIRGRADLLDRSPSLFETPSFRLWFLEKEEVARCRDLLEDAARSRIILAPHQQEGRFFEIYRQTVQELFDGNRRLLLRRRLEEMAFVLWQTGDENAAKISLAAALALAAEDKLLSPHPFLMELLKRTVLALRDEEKREKETAKEGGLIYRP
jgi:hypothetical protein